MYFNLLQTTSETRLLGRLLKQVQSQTRILSMSLLHSTLLLKKKKKKNLSSFPSDPLTESRWFHSPRLAKKFNEGSTPDCLPDATWHPHHLQRKHTPVLKFLLEHVLPLHLEKSHKPKSLSCCVIPHAKTEIKSLTSFNLQQEELFIQPWAEVLSSNIA